VIPIKDNIPTDRFPIVTVALILANVIVYVLSIRHGGSLISGPNNEEVVKYGAIPYAITHPSAHCGFVPLNGGEVVCTHRTGVVEGIPWYESIFTSMFMHGSIIQLAVNMLFLWIFGNTVEDSMGRIRYVVFYVLGGVAAIALQVAISPASHIATIGAAGAISAVVAGYVLLYPSGRVLSLVVIPFLFTVVEIPVLAMLGVWLIVQVVFAAVGLTTPTEPGSAIAYFATVGGFVFGLVTIKLFAIKRKATPPTRTAV
jgi:membrane associated rhomboid family serine protease